MTKELWALDCKIDPTRSGSSHNEVLANPAISKDRLLDFLKTLQAKDQLATAIELWKHLSTSKKSPPNLKTYLDRVTALLNDQGNVLSKCGRFEEALSYFNHALMVSELFAPVVLINAASCLKDLGRLDESIALYRRALTLKPDFEAAHSGLLLSLQYKEEMGPTELAAEHVEWNHKHGAKPRLPFHLYSGSPDPERTLKIGFVSGDLGTHPVGIFLIRFLENIDQKKFILKAYASTRHAGQLANRLRRAVTSWDYVDEYTADQLAKKISDDGIDILIDLSGHTAENRLAVFARKPAPIQISWIGYPGDTGLSAIDYVIGDRFVLPKTMQSTMQAKILQLPDSFVCFDPPSDAPAVSALPATVPGKIVLGCFQNPAKCNATIVRLWADILTRLPQSVLLLKYKGFGAPSTQKAFQSLFSGFGVDPSRIEFQGESPYREMFASLSRLDFALDAFPFSGGLMSCLTLWMGVPILTLPGYSFASRQGLSFLSTIGITDTIANSSSDYVSKAVALAHDLDLLASLRKRLRPTMERSPLCDGPKAAHALQDLLRKVWRDWCSRQLLMGT